MRVLARTRLTRLFLDEMPANTVAWGFKDPRTSLLIPYWLRLFPEARLVHVCRDASDVARSLMRRAEAWAQMPQRTPTTVDHLRHVALTPSEGMRWLGRKLGVLPALGPSPPLSRDRCIELHAVYEKECLAYSALDDRYLELHFDEIIANPVDAVSRLAEFAGVKASESRLEFAAAFVQRDRPANGGAPIGAGGA